MNIMLKEVFTQDRIKRISDWCRSRAASAHYQKDMVQVKGNKFIVILNNSSTLAHTTVLKGLMRIWPSHFAKPYIYVLFPKSKNALSSLREYLDLDDDSILNHSYSEEFDIPYLQNIINIVKPKVFLGGDGLQVSGYPIYYARLLKTIVLVLNTTSLQQKL